MSYSDHSNKSIRKKRDKKTCDSSLIALVRGYLETKRSKCIDLFSMAK